MSVTSKLKRGVDIPVFEWLRPTPIVTTGPSTLINGGKPDSRFLYFHATTTNGFYRYDTWADGWNQLTSAPQSFATVGNSTLCDTQGYFGRVISGSTNTIQCGVPRSKNAIGKTIKIVDGTGAGQVRTIVDISQPTVHDILTVTSGQTYLVQDTSKNFTINQYRDYMLRIIGNTNTDTRKILHNDANIIHFADYRFASVGQRWAYPLLPYTPTNTAGVQTICNIESYVVTVDSNWTVVPDSTSQFVIQTGVLQNVNVSVARFALQTYDILTDTWYQSGAVGSGYLAGNLATDCALAALNESGSGSLLTTNALSGAVTSVELSGVTLTTNQYANYIARITSGTGIGQDRLIESNTTTSLNVSRNWDIIPDNTSVFNIVGDSEKTYMIGNGGSAMFEYDAANDVWSDRRIFEVGCPSVFCAVWNGFRRPIGITGITRVGTVATATTNNPHGLKTGDVVNILGASDALYNTSNAAVTVLTSTTFTYNMTGTPAASPAVAANSQSTVQLVDPSKNWVAGSLVGKIVSFMITTFTQTGGQFASYLHKRITGNTATTISFNTATSAPISNNTAYVITDSRANGSIHYNNVAAGSTTSIINVVSGGLPTNLYAGRRIIVSDGVNWNEVNISSNTSTAITLGAALNFTPTTEAFINILGISPTGQGVCLEHLYNTSTLQKGKYLFAIRGANTNHTMRYDITSGTWEVLNQTPSADLYAVGTMAAYDGDDRVYFHQTQSGRIFYYDVNENHTYPAGIVPYAMSTASLGSRLAISKTPDGLKFLYLPRHSASEFWRVMLWL
jgi:hypothetical protein